MRMTSWRLCVPMALLPVWGCSWDTKLAVPPAEGVRIIVTTQKEYTSVGEVGVHAGNIVRLPVHEVVEVGPSRFRMVLGCDDEASCRAAIAKLKADRSFALGVDLDGRQQFPKKPPREASR